MFPVQNGRIILDLKCRASDQPVWDENVSSLLDGLKRGDRLSGITKNGFVPLKVGDITCSKGECHENYVTVQLDGSETPNEILGAVRDTRYSTVPLELQPADQKECADILDFKDTEFSEFPEVEEERKCDRLTLSEGSIVLATKAFAQDNGWNVYVRKAIVGKDGKKVVIDVDRSTSPLHPLIGLVDQNGRSTILWRKALGICCPSAVTLRLSWMSTSGELTFGRPYTAGGQPCD